MKRRRVLLGVTTVVSGAAGCMSPVEDGPTGTATRTSNPTENPTETPSPDTPTESGTDSPVTLKVTQIDEKDLSQYSNEEIWKFEELTQEQQKAFQEAYNSGSTTLHGEFDPGGKSDEPRVVKYESSYYRMDYYRA